MHELYELKDKLCKELKKYSKDDVTTNNLSVIDTLSHAIKNLDKIIEKYEEEESGSYGYNSYRNGRGNSYARGRGRNARRDNMGRYASDSGYSRHGDMVEQLREMMLDAPTEEIRKEYEKMISRIEADMQERGTALDYKKRYIRCYCKVSRAEKPKLKHLYKTCVVLYNSGSHARIRTFI